MRRQGREEKSTIPRCEYAAQTWSVLKLMPLNRLKLKVYRSLGIDVEADNAGTYNKAVIRNNAKGDVHVVNIDAKFSRFFYSNYLWQTMQ